MKRNFRVSSTAIVILLMILVLLIKGNNALSEIMGKDNPSPSYTSSKVPQDPSGESVTITGHPSTVSPEASDNAAYDPDIAPLSFLPSDLRLYSSHAVLLSLDTKEMLLDKGSKDKIYPASLTKIMTVITVIENLDNLDRKVLLSGEIYDTLSAENSSMAGFLPKEEVSAIDLLYGAMLPSGGECCMSLAEYIAGSESDFVQLMNDKAYELGMDQTHFTNTTGLHDSEHYTTVWDLAVLLQYSLKNDTFRQIFTSSRYTSSPTNLHPDGITMYSTLFKKLPNVKTENVKLLGGKTGYTSKAGLCLASLAEIGGKEYIMISAGAEGNHATEQYNITDALSVYSRISGKQFADKARP